MADNDAKQPVPASPYDAAIESAILMRVARPAIPPSLPGDIEHAIMTLEVGASTEEQDAVRKLWADYKVEQAEAEVAELQRLNAPAEEPES